MDTIEEFENLIRDKYLVDGEMILDKYKLFLLQVKSQQRWVRL